MSELTDNAVITIFHRKKWAATKQDKATSKEVTESKNAEEDAGKFSKSLVPKPCKNAPNCGCPTMELPLTDPDARESKISTCQTYAACVTAMGNASTDHYRMTLPWGENNERILPKANEVEYRRVMDAHCGHQQLDAYGQPTDIWVPGAYDHAADRFRWAYNYIKAKARERMGELYDDRDWPDIDVVRSKFRIYYDIEGIAAAEDFRVNLADRAVIEARMREREQERVAGSMRDAWNQLHNATMHMTARLLGAGAVCMCNQCTRNYPNGRPVDTDRLNESAVENVRQLCDMLPRLNITNDQQMTESIQRLRDMLNSVNVADLRSRDNAQRAALAEQSRREAEAQAEILALQAEPTVRRQLRRLTPPPEPLPEPSVVDDILAPEPDQQPVPAMAGASVVPEGDDLFTDFT